MIALGIPGNLLAIAVFALGALVLLGLVSSLTNSKGWVQLICVLTAALAALAASSRDGLDLAVWAITSAAVLGALERVAGETGHSVARIALAWVLSRPWVTSVIVIIGAKTKEQLADNLAVVDLELTGEQLALLDAASALPAEYPGWMVERQSADPRVKRS